MRKFSSRTIHRYLSVVIGIQLLLWTTSGLIFSWNPIKTVRGEDMIRKTVPVDVIRVDLMGVRELLALNDISPSTANVVRVELRTMLDQAVYEVETHSHEKTLPEYRLFDSVTGASLSPLTEDVASRIARNDFAADAQVRSVELIETVSSGHSEYRGKELPAWRVTLDHADGTVIYVSADRGMVTARRNSRWRMFDFFWMLHTMDYQGRDNFNSWLLRSVSVLGVATVLSGFWLWCRTTRLFRTRKARRSVDGL